MPWEELFYLLLSVALAFVLFSYIKNKKELFSGENFIKTLYTLGLLALGLIAFISYCVWMLNSSHSY